MELILARDYADPAARAWLDGSHRSGRLVRVTEGVYASAAEWEAADDRARHLAIADAAVATRDRRIVFSHWTAAAAWGLPILGEFPPDAHAVDRDAAGGRSDDRLVRHCTGIPSDTQIIDGREVTSLARTVIDIARVATLECAVVLADAALRDERGWRSDDPRAELRAELGPPGRRGVARAREVIGFADPAAASPGESLSRVSIARAGLPAPVLQHRIADAEGVMFVDFWWPGARVAGEFDGWVKYDDPRFLGGRTPREVLAAEKDRSDRLTAVGIRVVRWGWDTARSPARLRAKLSAAGVVPSATEFGRRYSNWGRARRSR